MLLTLVACSLENGLGTKPDPVVADSEPHFDSAVDSAGPPPTEQCNGEDDDGDGFIDEDFPDDDENGRVDCLDVECPTLVTPPEGTVESVCVSDPWDVGIEWQVSFGLGSYTLPVVGRLVDTDADGDVDDADLPVIVVSDLWGELTVFAGDGSGPLLTISGAHGISSPVIADVDQDGDVDLVTPMGDGSVAAFDGTGTELWTSEVLADPTIFPMLSVADLDGDGTVEIIGPTAVLTGADGSKQFSLPADLTRQRNPTVVDLDQDGDSEILLGRTWFDHEGTSIWDDTSRGLYSEFNAVVDADGDGLGDVITVSQSRMTLQTADGTSLWDIALPGTREPGPPAVGDFDGDGAVEICVPDEMELGVYELDGTQVWGEGMSDYSGWAGCAGLDIDGDGAMEVLMAGEQGFLIYDGATGAVLYSDLGHASGTLVEYPVAADVDDDGAAEIVIVDNMGGYNGLTVYGGPEGTWVDVGESWASYDLPLTAVADDGSVPSPATAPWDAGNLFHTRTGTLTSTPEPDLRVVIDDACVADCTFGPVVLGFHVENAGDAEVPAGTAVVVRSGDGTLITTLTLDTVPAGVALAGVTVPLDVADLVAGPLTVSVDEGGAVVECDETDNTATWDPGCAP